MKEYTANSNMILTFEVYFSPTHNPPTNTSDKASNPSEGTKNINVIFQQWFGAVDSFERDDGFPKENLSKYIIYTASSYFSHLFLVFYLMY